MQTDTYDAEPLLDLSAIERLIEETSLELVLSMMVVFHHETLARSAALLEEMSEGNLAKMEMSVHSIKGSSQTFGTRRLYLQAGLAEKLCLAHDDQAALEVCKTLPALIDVTLSALQQQLGYQP